MSRTFKHEPRQWDDYDEKISKSRYDKYVANKAPKLEFNIDNMLSFNNDNCGDNTFTRDVNA